MSKRRVFAAGQQKIENGVRFLANFIAKVTKGVTQEIQGGEL
jgi:hypothetical protein